MEFIQTFTRRHDPDVQNQKASLDLVFTVFFAFFKIGLRVSRTIPTRRCK